MHLERYTAGIPQLASCGLLLQQEYNQEKPGFALLYNIELIHFRIERKQQN